MPRNIQTKNIRTTEERQVLYAFLTARLWSKQAALVGLRRLNEHPPRFRAFAALPLADPKAAVEEFDRALTKLRFAGGFVAGSINGEFLDNKKNI
jgi:predicted TIM-barrel fold metal-dependent hydrolase